MHATGHDVPFVNNYGVWKDEFRDLGLESTLDHSWDDAMCYFGEGKEVRVGRGYGRCCPAHSHKFATEHSTPCFTQNTLALFHWPMLFLLLQGVQEAAAAIVVGAVQEEWGSL
jgi:hypothetical protein